MSCLVEVWALPSVFMFSLLSANLVRMQEASTALIRRLRKPPLSRTCRAWMVAPPGEHTLSFRCPGCSSDARSIRAAPFAKRRTRIFPECKNKHSRMHAFKPIKVKRHYQQGLGTEVYCQPPRKAHFHPTVSQSIYSRKRLQWQHEHH